MRAVIYIRVSSREQVDGTSLQFQEDLCLQYCRQRGYAVVEIFRDEGETAKDLSLGNRTRFLAALDTCKRAKPKIDAFVVLRVDRFARNVEDHFAVRRILASYGTALQSVTEPIGDSPAEKFIEVVFAGAADYDNALRKRRCTDGLIARIAEGLWPFHPPKGYLCARHRKHGEKKTVPDKPDPELFPTIQRGLRAFATGDVPTQAMLVVQLNQWGFAKGYGRAATKQIVSDMLGRLLPFYSGFLVSPFDGNEYPGKHEAMISRQERAQIDLRLRGKVPHLTRPRARMSLDFPLRRIARCSCGAFLTAGNSRGRNRMYGYYFCFNRDCPLKARTTASDPFHVWFSDQLRALSMTPAALEKTESIIEELWREQKLKRPDFAADIERKRQTLMERKRRVCEMREDGTYDSAMTRERLGAIEAELDALPVPTASPSMLADLDRFMPLMSFAIVIGGAGLLVPSIAHANGSCGAADIVDDCESFCPFDVVQYCLDNDGSDAGDCCATTANCDFEGTPTCPPDAPEAINCRFGTVGGPGCKTNG